MSSDILTVTILSKEYQIQCPIDQHQRLTEASLVLDKKMKTIKNEVVLYQINLACIVERMETLFFTNF